MCRCDRLFALFGISIVVDYTQGALISIRLSNRTLEEKNSRISPVAAKEILGDELQSIYQMSMDFTQGEFKMRHARAHLNRIYDAADGITSFFLFSFLDDVSCV